MTKKLPLEVKLSRKPTSRACVFCHQKHLQCDPSRPCKNCVKRNIADTCEDVKRKKSKAQQDPKSDTPIKEKGTKTSRENKENTTKTPKKPKTKKGSAKKEGSKVSQINDDPGTSLDMKPVSQVLQNSSSGQDKSIVPDIHQINNSTIDDVAANNVPTEQASVNKESLQTITSSNLSIFKGSLQNILNTNDTYQTFSSTTSNPLSNNNAKFFVGTPPAEISNKSSMTKLNLASSLQPHANLPENLHNGINFEQLPKPDIDNQIVHAKHKEDNDADFEIVNNFETEINFFDTNSDTNGSSNNGNDIHAPNNNFDIRDKDDTEFSNFFYDGLNNQVLLRPFIKLSENDHAMSISDSQSMNSNFGTPAPPEITSNSHINNNVNTPAVETHTYFPDSDKNKSTGYVYNQFGNIMTNSYGMRNNIQSTKEFIDTFKRNNQYKSPLYIRKKVFQEVGDLYSKFPIFDLNRLYKNRAVTNNRDSSNSGIYPTNTNDNAHDNQYNDLKHILEILSFNSMKSYQELIKYFYDRLYLQCTDNFEHYNDQNLERRKSYRQKLFFKILEKIWMMHNHFRIQSALIQTDFNSVTNFSDNLLNELIFHRQLLNFENMINTLTSTPAIIWRKSTEIVFIGDELCTLIGIKNKSKFLSRRRFLCEIIDEISILNYFKLCNSIFLKNKDPGNYHSHQTRSSFDTLENELSDERINNGSCVLNGGIVRFNCKFINHNYNPTKIISKKTEISLNETDKKSIFPYEINEELESQQRFISCSCILTIKKDMFDIPMLIVGQFLPILE